MEEKKNQTRRFVGRKTANNCNIKENLEENSNNINNNNKVKKFYNKKILLRGGIPEEILSDEELNNAIENTLPKNYNFEIHKTIWKARENKVKCIGLQMPEGLLIYSAVISDILKQFISTLNDVIIMGDVTYGACCVDDFTARALGADMLVHYAHSCLIPLGVTNKVNNNNNNDDKQITILYVFVTIEIDVNHAVSTIEKNYKYITNSEIKNTNKAIALVGTIQFNPALREIQKSLEKININCIIPQINPLSKGEILGCTSPSIDESKVNSVIYIGDGRFHLESAMIANPSINAYRYDPYSRELSIEVYDHDEMRSTRKDAIFQSAHSLGFDNIKLNNPNPNTNTNKQVVIILGTLGRQGNVNTMNKIEDGFKKAGVRVTKVLISEISPIKLAQFDTVDVFVQVACPRLSIDWGYAFHKPLLSPYEALVLLGISKPWYNNNDIYPMDYYAKDGLGRISQ